MGTVLEGCLVVSGGRDGAGEALDSVEVSSPGQHCVDILEAFCFSSNI